MGRRSYLLALCALSCATVGKKAGEACASTEQCAQPLVCYSAASQAGLASKNNSLCATATFPGWRKARPCRNTSDCGAGSACFADIIYDCHEKQNCAEHLVGRCFDESGSHHRCKTQFDCYVGETCGHTHLLICPNDGPCHIGLIGQTHWGGQDWGGATESLCVHRDPKRWVPMI